jgi:taurine transport system permease protein
MPPFELSVAKEVALQSARPEPVTYRAPSAWRARLPMLVTVLLLLALWEGVTGFGLVPALFLPAPQQVLTKLVDIATSGFMDATLWQHTEASLVRVGLAVLAALATAVPLGVLIGLNRTVSSAIDPLIEFYRPVPPLAYLPLIVIWFGIGEVSKVLLIYLAIFAPLVLATSSGVRRADKTRVLAARSLGASRGQLVRYVILPSALPDILTGLRIALGVGWSTLVAAELIAAQRGLGFMVQSASQFLVTDVVIAGILVIAAIALVLELSIRYLERRYAGWAH